MGGRSETSAQGFALDRRSFLRLGLSAAIALSPIGASAATEEKRLSLLNVHTGERVSAVYWARGHYLRESLGAVDRVLRDHRTDEIHAIEPRLLDLLHRVQRAMGARGEFHVISGYRSLKTNEALRRGGARVASTSLHLMGEAIDVRLPGRALRDLRRAALGAREGGVGFYPRGDFVHLDVGRVRSW